MRGILSLLFDFIALISCSVILIFWDSLYHCHCVLLFLCCYLRLCCADIHSPSIIDFVFVKIITFRFSSLFQSLSVLKFLFSFAEIYSCVRWVLQSKQRVSWCERRL